MSEDASFPGLLKIMKRLVEIMEREIVLLHGVKSQELEDLQRNKISLAAAYEARVRALRESQPALDPAWRAEFSQTAQSFQDTLLRNHHALNAAKATTDRVLQAIVREVEKQRSQQAYYSADGQCATGVCGNQPVSVAIDQRL